MMRFAVETEYQKRQREERAYDRGLYALIAVGIAAISIFVASPFVTYQMAPKKQHCVQKNETAWAYFSAENTKGKLSWDSYKSDFLRINDSDIGSIAKNKINIDNLLAGTTVYLRDINRDGKVGK